ncbi:MAG: hypothetical protein M1540_03305 [Candidatus Bathyarchaeota archaeon]|nr:hypothetical protein [Candidatus Bathyarchaeota archaeon]
MKPAVGVVVFAFILLLADAAEASATTVNQQTFPQLAMPIEHINYTITKNNVAVWATVDGEYPIHTDNRNLDGLPMLYPMPPNATNITVTLNGKEVAWSNYTQTYSSMVHKTAIGDWWQIYCLLENISDTFTLRIHYEHPLEAVNGSYVFLYDLNIAQYLSAENPTSTAYFTVYFETDLAELDVYTAPPDSAPSEWKPKEYTLTHEGAVSTLKVEMQSQYAIVLPGDLAIVFSDGASPSNSNSKKTEESPLWIIPVALDIFLIAIVLYVKRKSLVSWLSSRKSAG